MGQFQFVEDMNFKPKQDTIFTKNQDKLEDHVVTRNFLRRNMKSTRGGILSLIHLVLKSDMNLFDVYQQMNTQGGYI